jgi:hypothetical protein
MVTVQATEILEDVVRWLRQEVAPIIASGANWKVIISGSGSGDVRGVVEKHQDVRRRSPRPNRNSKNDEPGVAR